MTALVENGGIPPHKPRALEGSPSERKEKVGSPTITKEPTNKGSFDPDSKPALITGDNGSGVLW